MIFDHPYNADYERSRAVPTAPAASCRSSRSVAVVWVVWVCPATATQAVQRVAGGEASLRFVTGSRICVIAAERVAGASRQVETIPGFGQDLTKAR